MTKNKDKVAEKNEAIKNQRDNQSLAAPKTQTHERNKKNNDIDFEALLQCIPNKIKFDPKTTSPKIHLGIGFGSMFFLFFLAFVLEEPTSSNRTPRYDLKRGSKSLEQYIEKLQEQEEANAAIVDNYCRVYIAPSTIPGNLFGLFAGESFEKDDFVLHKGISLNSLHIPSYYLNSHPNITNLDDDFKAVTYIAKGQELFIKSNSTNLHEIFCFVDYLLHDFIKSMKMKKAGKDRFGNFGNNDSLVRMIKSMIRKLDVNISSFLPNSYAQLRQFDKDGAAYASLNNRTLYFLKRNGVCLYSDLKVSPKTVEENETIAIIPLIRMDHALDEEICHLVNGVYLCPIYEFNKNSDLSKVNAKFNWTQTGNETTAEKANLGYELKLVALKSINFGDKIILQKLNEEQCIESAK